MDIDDNDDNTIRNKRARTVGASGASQDTDMRDGASSANNGVPSFDDLINKFEMLEINKVRRDAWVIYKDDPTNPEALTRGMWLDKFGELPTETQFKKHGFTIHASYTGQEHVDEHGQFPPQVFINKIKLSKDQENFLNSIDDDKKRSSTRYKLKYREMLEVCKDIGCPVVIVESLRYNLEGNDQVYMPPKTGRVRYRTAEYKDPALAGENHNDLILWKGQDIVGYISRDKNGIFDDKSLEDAKKITRERYGEGIDIAIKSKTQAYYGVEYLEKIGANSAKNAWASQIGAPLERNETFDRLTAAVVYKANGKSIVYNLDVDHLFRIAPQNDLAVALRNGKGSEYLYVMSKNGEARYGIEWAMNDNNKDKTIKATATELLNNAGIPLSIAEPRTGDQFKKVAALQPAVGVQLEPYKFGAPPAGVKILDAYKPHEIMIANRGNDGMRTGHSRTLAAYEARKESLPWDAAAELNLDPDVYMASAVHSTPASQSARSALKNNTRDRNRDTAHAV